MSVLFFLSILIPLILGIVIYFIKNNQIVIKTLVSIFSSITVICVILLMIFTDQRFEFFKLTNNLSILFKNDGVSNFFAIIISSGR